MIIKPELITQDIIRSLKLAKRHQEAHQLMMERNEWLKTRRSQLKNTKSERRINQLLAEEAINL